MSHRRDPSNRQFRVTPWPDHRLVGGWRLPLRYEVDPTDQLLIPVGETHDGPLPTADPGETYLKLIETDLESPDAIAVAASEHGLLGIHHRASALSGFRPWLRVKPPKRGVREQSFPPDLQWIAAQYPDAPAIGESVEEFKFGVRCLRDLVTLRRLMDGDVAGAGATWEVLDPSGWGNAHDQAALILSGVFGPDGVLEPFHPRLLLVLGDQGSREAPRGTWLIGGSVGLFAVCCLELFNHVAEVARYRTCANATCRRLFVRQEGRAVVGQHRRAGLVYCSYNCARMETQRRYRRSKRKEK